MRSQWYGIAIIVLPAAGLGCGDRGPTLTTQEISARAPTISYEIRDGSPSKKGVLDGGSVKAGKHTLELVKNRISLDGKGYGTVKGGDVVVVEKGGKLTVNGGDRGAE